MANRNVGKFDLMRLAPELQVKVFEALPSPVAAMDLALSCRALNMLYGTYKTQIMAAIRDNIVAPFYEYYAFHATLHIPESDISRPPPGGWPNITPAKCSDFGKSDFVIDVLRHLPYIRQDDTSSHIDDLSNVVDYSKTRPSDLAAYDTRYRKGDARWSRGPEFRYKVAVAKAHSVCTAGVDIILDTRTGEVFEEFLRSAGGGEATALPVRDYFARKMGMCRELRMVFVPGNHVYVDRQYREGEVDEGPPYDAEVMERMGEPVGPAYGFRLALEMDRDWVCHLYRKFGCPGNNWKKEEGLKAIMEYRDRRNGVAEIRAAEMRRKREETMQRLGPGVGVLHCF